jgi:lysine 2,3-aminomutase
MKHIHTIEALTAQGLTKPAAQDDLQRVVEQFALRITPHVAAHLSNPAIAKQYIPTTDELIFTPDELADPIGDDVHTPVKGITHRYADRVLLKPTHTCAVYCRFCFRRETVGHAEQALNEAELQTALAYIQAHPEIWEVILSGGDPLVLSDRRLKIIVEALAATPHVEVLRLHTRVPVVEPERITPELIATLKSRLATYVVIHINHSDELTQNVKTALARLADAGIPLLSQSVLLRGINDNVAALTKLMRSLVASRVKPYYLHQTDLAKGTGHFRVPLAEGQELMRQLRGPVSGLCQPTYVLDIPGGHSKVPVGPSYIDGDVVVDPKGERHELKNFISPAQTPATSPATQPQSLHRSSSPL